jgi:hypothetical protein
MKKHSSLLGPLIDQKEYEVLRIRLLAFKSFYTCNLFFLAQKASAFDPGKVNVIIKVVSIASLTPSIPNYQIFL